MRRFSFRLEPLLNIRRARENTLLSELAVLRRKAQEEKKLLDQMRQRSIRAIMLARERRLTDKDPRYQIGLQPYLKALRHDTEAQQEAVRHAETAVETKLAETLEAMKARKTLEKLEERQQQEHFQETTREEGKQMDDFASLAAQRGR